MLNENTDCDEEYQKLLAAWQKAPMIKGVNPNIIRKDCSGRVMNWINYGDQKSDYGWKISRLPNSSKAMVQDHTEFEAVHIGSAISKRHSSSLD